MKFFIISNENGIIHPKGFRSMAEVWAAIYENPKAFIEDWERVETDIKHSLEGVENYQEEFNLAVSMDFAGEVLEIEV